MAKDRQEPSDEEVEAAARALVEWQFPLRENPWEAIPDSMKAKFREGAVRALRAAGKVARSQRFAAS